MTTAYLAIDSGGTRTTLSLVVEQPEGTTRKIREVPEALSGYLDPYGYSDTLRKILAPIEAHWRSLHLDEVPVHTFISAAGFAESSRDDFLTAVGLVLPTALGGQIRTAGAANDATTLLLGHRADGAVIAGTGSNVLVRDTAGAIHQAGGHEWVASDYGAGFWIGLEALRSVARAFDDGRETTLLHRFAGEYHVSLREVDEVIACFRSLAVADADMKADIAKFAASVCAAAQKGDEEAQDIVKRQAEELADSTVRAIRRRFLPEEIDAGLHVVQCGSVLGNNFYRSSFEAQVHLRLYSNSDSANEIRWTQVGDGLQAAETLARVAATDPESLLATEPRYRPIVLSF